ncbi:MAG: hypothetical protein M1834_001444 [Cirrosporium novae-zelandiae]|nr:MAG: hypothetical protein M1834_001444 [Cirrosporium novae-zelandiae]
MSTMIHVHGYDDDYDYDIGDYDRKWAQGPNSEGFGKGEEAIFRRIQDLVAILKHRPKPTQFPALDCLSAFYDTQRQEFGIVYEYTDQASVLSKVLLATVVRKPPKVDCEDAKEIQKHETRTVDSSELSSWSAQIQRSAKKQPLFPPHTSPENDYHGDVRTTLIRRTRRSPSPIYSTNSEDERNMTPLHYYLAVCNPRRTSTEPR